MSSTLLTSASSIARSVRELRNVNEPMAIIACCPVDPSQMSFPVKPLQTSFISSLDASCQYALDFGDRRIPIFECLPGRADIASVIEELAHRGIKSILGIGYAKTLTTLIPAGQIVLAECAVNVESSSCRFSYPSHGLFSDFRRIAAARCISIRRAKVVAADADDPDYARKTTASKSVGAEVVFPQAMKFYSAGRVNGVSAVFACVISREAGDENHPVVSQGMSDLHALIMTMIGY
jgi:purine-nucleoside phosphorylase